jgi:hypothetical protein
MASSSDLSMAETPHADLRHVPLSITLFAIGFAGAILFIYLCWWFAVFLADVRRLRA